jgi:hypothetical protein
MTPDSVTWLPRTGAEASANVLHKTHRGCPNTALTTSPEAGRRGSEGTTSEFEQVVAEVLVRIVGAYQPATL